MSCAHLRTVNLIRDLAVSMEKLFRLLEEKKLDMRREFLTNIRCL
jgi:succinate dehydrogenase/fumarate reductase-like Fe-S protein